MVEGAPAYQLDALFLVSPAVSPSIPHLLPDLSFCLRSWNWSWDQLMHGTSIMRGHGLSMSAQPVIAYLCRGLSSVAHLPFPSTFPNFGMDFPIGMHQRIKQAEASVCRIFGVMQWRSDCLLSFILLKWTTASPLWRLTHFQACHCPSAGSSGLLFPFRLSFCLGVVQKPCIVP